MEPLQPGDPRHIGIYRLCGRLGAGGMGRVFLGLSPAGRAVAVKVVHPELAEKPEFVQRFRREVRAAEAVSGAYTAPVVAAGTENGMPWLATLFVAGPSLADVISQVGPLPETALWRLLGGLVEALEAVHAKGLVHRDLKPANILLAFDGPRVIDFGISRALDSTRITARRAAIGTPGYMSPEQLNGFPVGPPGDVFALGSVMAFAGTGANAFGGGDEVAIAYRVVHAEPDLTGMPASLRDLVTKCLAKVAADRPPLTWLLDAATAWPGSFPGSALASFWPDPPAGIIRSCQEELRAQTTADVSHEATLLSAAPSPAALADPSCIGEGSTATRTAGTRLDNPARARAAKPRPATEPRSTISAAGRSGHAAAAPKAGRTPMADVRAGRGTEPRRVRRDPRTRIASGIVFLCILAATIIIVTANFEHVPALSPTSTFSNPQGWSGLDQDMVLSPSGKIFATSSPQGDITLWNIQEGSIAGTFSDPAHGNGDWDSLAFSPNGSLLASINSNGLIYLWKVSTGRNIATLADQTVSTVAFSPDGRVLAAGDWTGHTTLWDVATGNVLDTVTDPGSAGVGSLAFSPNGQALATGDCNGKTYLWSEAGEHRIASFAEPAVSRSETYCHGAVAVAFSPSRQELAVGDANGNTYLWNVAAKRESASFADPESGKGIEAVAFCPHSDTLVAGDSSGAAYLWNIPDRSKIAAIVDPSASIIASVACSPDGRSLLTSDFNGNVYLWNVSSLEKRSPLYK